MKKLLSLSLLISINLSALDLICMGNSNTNQLIQVEVELDKRLGNVTIGKTNLTTKYIPIL